MLSDIVWTRPWMWLTLPIFFFALYRYQRTHVSRQQAVFDWFDPHLFHYLSQSMPSTQKRWIMNALYFAALCLSIFLAGPALVVKDSERFTETRGAVIVLDLGLQSLATDLVPNRLQQAKYKIEDLLNSATNYEYGIIAVANDAYVITPISPDASTLINQLPSLHPEILPTTTEIADISRLNKGVQEGKKLLSGSGYENGLILVISYSPTDTMLSDMTAQKGSFALVYWQFGSEQGGPIKLSNDKIAKDDNDNIIISKAFPPKFLPDGLTWLSASSDSNDIEQIAYLIASLETKFKKDLDNQIEMLTPIDSYFLFPILVMVVIFLRRPNLIFSSYLLAMLTIVPNTGFTQENINGSEQLYSLPEVNIPLSWRPDSLMTQDQLGLKYFKQQDYLKAIEVAQSKTIKSMASLAMNDFERTKKLLIQPQNAIDFYHLGLAHFALKEYIQALSAFESALQNNPNMYEAQENYEALKRFLDQQGNNQNQNKQDQNGDKQSNAQNESQQGQQQQASNDSIRQNRTSNDTPISGRDERQIASKSGGQGSEAKGQNSSEETEKSNFFDDLFISKDKTYSDVDEQDIVQTELFGNLRERPPLDAQGIKVVVRKVPDDPSFLLKQRLKLIYQQRQKEKGEND